MARRCRTFIDSGVLIAAVRGEERLKTLAARVLGDPTRLLVSSNLVRLELLPKPLHFKKSHEVEFLHRYFAEVEDWIPVNERMLTMALEKGSLHGLNAIDALHAATAMIGNVDEFVTTEKRSKPLAKISGVRVLSLGNVS